MVYLLSNVPVDDDAAAAVAAPLGIPVSTVVSAALVRKSLDARARPPRWVGVYRVELVDGQSPGRGARPWTERDEARQQGVVPVTSRTWTRRPIVVGAGPAGLFAALRLAEAGAPAVLLERGQPVEGRIPEVNRFWRGQPLDPENNILFGEGGAGTFSDGKIYTRRRDGELGWVFRTLVDAGADPGILQEAWAHLGTDKVRAILPVLRKRLLAGGVEVRFGARVTGFIVEAGVCVGVRIGEEELRGGPVVVATGHSARDTMEALLAAGAVAELRPIAIGARIEHPQDLIDAARYPTGRGDLPASSYRLAWTPKEGRAAYTFCMCPGGLVVPAQGEADHVVVNGMSFSTRRARWANSALIVQVDLADYGATDPLAGVRFQDRIERAAFVLSGSYAAPSQRVEDFLAGRGSTELPRTSYPLGVAPTDLAALLPAPILAAMRTAIRKFDDELPGFAGPDGVLIAPETRTTAPLRFLRDEVTLQSPSLPGLMPCGEGAGYAGGIVSAALDGFRVAQAIVGS